MKRLPQPLRPALCAAAGLTLALFVFTIGYFFSYLFPYADQDVMELFDGWSYSNESDPAPHELPPLSKADGVAPGETLIVTRTLREDTGLSVLMIKYYYQTVRVFLDDRMLWESPPPPARQNPGAGLAFLPLKEEDQGKEIRLEITSPYDSYSGVLMPVYLGGAAALQAKLFSEAMPHIFFLFVCTVIGFFFLIYSIQAVYQGHKAWNSFFFGLFSVLLGFFCISRDDFIYLLFPPVAATDIAISLHTIYLIPLMAYLYCYFTKHRKLVRAILAVLSVSAVLFHLLYWTGLCEFPSLIPVINWTLTLCFLPIVGLVLYELLHGNHIIRFLFPIIILVIAFSVGTILLYYKHQQSVLSLYLFGVFLLVITIWIYHLREFVRQRVQEKKELQALQFRNELTQKSYEAMASHMREARMLRHEVGHHIAALKILNDQGESERIADYLSAISEQINTEAMLYTENDLVNCIVSDCFSRAARVRIRFSIDIRIPRSLPMEDPDLCSLLTNLLDNALEAAERVPEKLDRWIDLRMRTRGDFLIVSCANSSTGHTAGQENNFISSKTGDHGYGIPIMRSIAQKYGSPLNIVHDSDSFQVKMALQLPIVNTDS